MLFCANSVRTPPALLFSALAKKSRADSANDLAIYFVGADWLNDQQFGIASKKSFLFAWDAKAQIFLLVNLHRMFVGQPGARFS